MTHKKIITIISLLLLFIRTSLYAAPVPHVSLYLDELGNSSAPYEVFDSQNHYDGIAYKSPSMGNGFGKICSAIDLRASSTKDYIILDKDSLHGAEDFTISTWYKGTSSKGRAILSGARVGQDNELLWWLTSGNKFHGYIDGGSGTPISVPSIIDDKWHQLVWRRSGKSNCFFTDGALRGCSNTSPKTLVIDSLIIGQEQDTVGGKFSSAQDIEAIIDEFLIFKTALSDAEITSIYNNQNAEKTWDGKKHICQKLPVDKVYSDWHFDEASYNGTPNEIKDSHGSYHGTGHSVTTIPGKICNGIDLRKNSISDYATLGAGSFNGANDFTVSVWHKGAAGTVSKSLLSGAYSGNKNEAILWFTSPTAFNGHLKGTSLGGLNVNAINDDKWHHFAWTRDGAKSCFYMDKVFKGCQSSQTSAPLTITSLILGQEQDTLGGGFQVSQDWEGIIDELIIFRRTLSSAQITNIYNNQNVGKNWDGGVPRACSPPVMKLKKTAIVISDPLNSTTNPKRIPGSIVRYTITASNSSQYFGENITIGDNLTTGIVTQGNIAWHGNIKVQSPNINGGALKSLTDATGDDEGEFTSNNVVVRCGHINNTAPCIVTYDVEVTN